MVPSELNIPSSSSTSITAALEERLPNMSSSDLATILSSHAVVATEIPPTDEIPLFPNLPIELRVRIWKMSFRRRRVFIHIHPQNDIYENSHPVTLFVNRESRQETLKHYHPLVQIQAFSGRPRFGHVPIYLNPEIDTAVLGFDQSYWSWIGGGLSWEEYSKSFKPMALGAIREVEFLDTYWNLGVEYSFDEKCKYHKEFKQLLLAFMGLQKMYFTNLKICKYVPPAPTPTPGKVEIQRVIKGFFERHKDSYVDNKAPEVDISWKDTESDEESQYDYVMPMEGSQCLNLMILRTKTRTRIKERLEDLQRAEVRSKCRYQTTQEGWNFLFFD